MERIIETIAHCDKDAEKDWFDESCREIYEECSDYDEYEEFVVHWTRMDEKGNTHKDIPTVRISQAEFKSWLVENGR